MQPLPGDVSDFEQLMPRLASSNRSRYALVVMFTKVPSCTEVLMKTLPQKHTEAAVRKSMQAMLKYYLKLPSEVRRTWNRRLFQRGQGPATLCRTAKISSEGSQPKDDGSLQRLTSPQLEAVVAEFMSLRGKSLPAVRDVIDRYEQVLDAERTPLVSKEPLPTIGNGVRGNWLGLGVSSCGETR